MGSAGRGAYLSALFAHVRLLSGVNTSVDCKGGALDELLAASFEIADVWPDAAVNALCIKSASRPATTNMSALTVASQIASPRETFSAGRASERLGQSTASVAQSGCVQRFLFLLLHTGLYGA